MIGPQTGFRASIPEISIRYAADYSRDISLRLLDNIEKTVDSRTTMEKELGEVYLAKQQAARRDPNLQGENEDLVVTSYDRAINRICNALDAVESLKRTLMDLQALARPASRSYDSVEELLADQKA